MGGYAPYSSTAGILISSIKTTNDLPLNAPNSFFLIWFNFDSSVDAIELAFVYAENVKQIESIFLSVLQTANVDATSTDFPAPVPPVK